MVAVNRSPFYPWIAIALSLVIVAGFSRTYYLRFLSDLPPMTVLVHLHGIVFTAWLALFIAQTRLIAAHRVDLHMKLGIAGVVLAAIITVVGLWTLVVGAGTPRVRATGLTNTQHTLVGITSIGMFAVFIALGVATRRRSALHKRYMVLAMIAILSPATSRLMARAWAVRVREHFRSRHGRRVRHRLPRVRLAHVARRTSRIRDRRRRDRRVVALEIHGCAPGVVSADWRSDRTPGCGRMMRARRQWLTA